MAQSIRIEGPSLLRFNIVYSILSGKQLRISKIRHLAENPGVTNAEVSFLRLIETITNGSKFIINETGTQIKFKPGFTEGGIRLVHNCDCSRGLGYYIEPLLLLLPFAHKPTEITLRGVTNHELDTSVDVIRTVFVPLLAKFGVEGLGLKLTRRGLTSESQGEVKIECTPVQSLKSVDFSKPGPVKRVRGLCYTSKISATVSNRVRSAARAVLNNFIPDVWVYTEHQSFKEGGTSPGFGFSLVAESVNGSLVSVDHCAPKKRDSRAVWRSSCESFVRRIKSKRIYFNKLTEFHFIIDGRVSRRCFQNKAWSAY